MKAKITDKKEIAKGTLFVEFQVMEPMDFKPGQYMDIILQNPPYNDAKGPKRHFSIINSPTKKGVLQMATRLRDSAFKKSLAEFPIGTEVEIPHLGGNFILPEDSSKTLVFIAGGIGITPFMSMLRFIQDQNLPHKVTLLYSNRNKESTTFYDELEQIAKDSPNIKIIFTMTEDPSWTGEKRKIDANFVKEYISELSLATYMIAGPPEMVEAMFNVLKEAGVEENNIITENFTGY